MDNAVLADVTSLGTSGQMWTTQTSTGLGNNGFGSINAGVGLTDTDNDGLPDIWETSLGLNPNSAADGATVTASGYTQLENYLTWLTMPHAVIPTNTPTDIDLWLYTLGFTNAAFYAVSSPTNCTVTIINTHVAHIVPNCKFHRHRQLLFQSHRQHQQFADQ